MVAIGGRAGVRPVAAGAGWARASGRALGNELPPITGRVTERPFAPGPAPRGQVVAGQLGANDGSQGADPDVPKVQPWPKVNAWGEGDPGDTEGTQSFRRFGLQGFNNKLTVTDRHAYWDAGNQRTANTPSIPGNPPNPVTDGPVRPDLRTVNRTVSWQLGSDHTANQDDLSRPYTWVGEQGTAWTPINGGVPGLYIPYGSRGGVPYPIVDPTQGEGGRELVWGGPPHGLHSLTFPDYGDTLARYQATQQQVPGRLDRPANSPQAGQSYSQTVQPQAETRASGGRAASRNPGANRHSSRGWKGR